MYTHHLIKQFHTLEFIPEKEKHTFTQNQQTNLYRGFVMVTTGNDPYVHQQVNKRTIVAYAYDS
jgi:predicted alpha/beta hydrolase family esterase